ncbi:hypothetical protein M408DRAFT_100316 [Serendipita vermifera MAFF 305830]|uniref:DRBM domain-containing protein n=1 Tax=Serendipita vermifera MAFF 305830 TaxID=933852 RepID=A0A0C2WV35_SERVB|nr:hypothetical protein M408DRAFT_100316 [Serendipita vermifera MAFF 305830]
MSAEQPRITQTAPPNDPADHWRQLLSTLTSSYGLSFDAYLQYDEAQRGWWATYYLLNPNNTYADRLGTDIGTSKNIAKEWAAYRSYAILVTLIQQWTQSASET